MAIASENPGNGQGTDKLRTTCRRDKKELHSNKDVHNVPYLIYTVEQMDFSGNGRLKSLDAFTME